MPIRKFGGRPIAAARSAAVVVMTGGSNGPPVLAAPAELPLPAELPAGFPPLDVAPPPPLPVLFGLDELQPRDNPNAAPKTRHCESLIICGHPNAPRQGKISLTDATPAQARKQGLSIGRCHYRRRAGLFMNTARLIRVVGFTTLQGRGPGDGCGARHHLDSCV